MIKDVLKGPEAPLCIKNFFKDNPRSLTTSIFCRWEAEIIPSSQIMIKRQPYNLHNKPTIAATYSAGLKHSYIILLQCFSLITQRIIYHLKTTLSFASIFSFEHHVKEDQEKQERGLYVYSAVLFSSQLQTA